MASDQQFCLRWNNHQSTLVSVFDNLLESQTLVDCTLAADGQYLKAHKVVLSACSPYLESILCQNLDKHPILILKDVKFSELKAMLDYMYRGEVNISQEQLSTFLKAAESLQIKGLTDSGGGGGSSEPRERDLLKRQDLRKPLNQPVPHIPQPRPVVPHPGLLEPRRSLPHFPPHIADMQPQSPRHAREGSTSPTARKRRRPNRPSSDDSNFVSTPNSLSENQPDTSDSCDVPVKQSAPSTPSNVPNLSTKAQETDSPRTTPQPQINSDQKQIIVKKEFSEALLTPKTELDYGNDNSMEDVNYEDEEDEEVDLSKPGTSFATNNQGFPPWQMGGDASNDDSSIYSPDVSTAATQNNSQGPTNGFILPEVTWSPVLKKSSIQRGNHEASNREVEVSAHSTLTGNNRPVEQDDKSLIDVNPKGINISSSKRLFCSKCNEYVYKSSIRLHSKYYCGACPDEREWKLRGAHPVCMSCNKFQSVSSIEFHVKYLCKKNPISVQCFYCPSFFEDYKALLKHMLCSHKKKHCFLDLMSILPPADPQSDSNVPMKVVKHFFNNAFSAEGHFRERGKKDRCLQVRQKTTYKCQSCGKGLDGIHAYQNHINTKCESVMHYFCFFCPFKAEYAYETIEHMESHHGIQFNTYDIIQAQLTGIIPTVEGLPGNSSYGDAEEHFGQPELFEQNMKRDICDKREKGNKVKISSVAKVSDMKPNTKNHALNQKKVLKKSVRLAVAKRKVNIGKMGGPVRGKNVPKIDCSKCHKLVHPKDFRIHKKYHCGKEHVKKDWVLKSGRALCLKCKQLRLSAMIDFHVKYSCSTIKKHFTYQCLYCVKIFNNCRTLNQHMKKLHNKSHYYQDMMSILPDPDKLGKKNEIVFKHPFTYFSKIKSEQSSPQTKRSSGIFKFPESEDYHTCLHCEYSNIAAYKVLDHLEDIHKKKYNLYDLLKAKMAASKFV